MITHVESREQEQHVQSTCGYMVRTYFTRMIHTCVSITPPYARRLPKEISYDQKKTKKAKMTDAEQQKEKRKQSRRILHVLPRLVQQENRVARSPTAFLYASVWGERRSLRAFVYLGPPAEAATTMSARWILTIAEQHWLVLDLKNYALRFYPQKRRRRSHRTTPCTMLV